MKLLGPSPVVLVQRAWFYFRIGNGAYLSFVLGFIQFITVEYALLISRLPFLGWLHFSLFIALFLPGYSLLAIYVGRLHNKTQAFVDSQLSATQTPYLYKILPVGKEPLLSMPMALEQIDLWRTQYEDMGKLTPERKARLDKFEAMIKTLLEGGEIH